MRTRRGHVGHLASVCSVTFALLLFATNGSTAESSLDRGVVGHWGLDAAAEKLNWQAYWIWDQDDGAKPTENHLVVFRKSFELASVPSEAVLRITASSRYKLYINGEYVLRGPSRSAPHHQAYDVLDVASRLTKGMNLIAVQVHYHPGGRSYHLRDRGGLLAQLDLRVSGEDLVIGTDETWAALPDASWDNQSPRLSRFHLQVADRVDLRRYPAGWEQPGYDDAGWGNAVGLMRTSGWPSVQSNDLPRALTAPWTLLEPRRIPYLEEGFFKASNLVEAHPVKGYFYDPARAGHRPEDMPLSGEVSGKINIGDYVAGNAPLTIPASDEEEIWFLLFDLGQVVNGLPQLHIEGQRGTEVEVIGVPFVLDNEFTYRTVDADLLDKITLSGGNDVWQAQYFKPTRYLALAVKAGSRPMRIHSVGVHSLEYPFVSHGSMTSESMPWISQYVSAAEKTIRVCTTDGYTDNYRERRQYAQTGYYAAIGNYWTFGDHALQARKLVQVAQEAEPNGLFPAYGPLLEEDYMVILDSNLLWIRSLHNFYLYSGDIETTERLLPTALAFLGLIANYTNEGGLIDSPPYAYWLDHARIDRRGANLALNGHYIGALEDVARMLRWLGRAGADVHDVAAAKARETIRTEFFDESKGLFTDALIDGSPSDQFSEHSQAMALALGIATQEQADSIARLLLAGDDRDFIRHADSGVFLVTPAMSYFLHKGLAEYGFVDESMALLKRRFDHMLEPGTNGTFWEEWWRRGSGRSGVMGLLDRTRSDAQTESAFAPALFAEYLLGVKPVGPGMKELEITRTASSLQDISATFPTPQGLMGMAWVFDDDSGELTLDVPEGITAKVDKDSLVIGGRPQVTVNGEVLKPGSRFLEVGEGSHSIRFKHSR